MLEASARVLTRTIEGNALANFSAVAAVGAGVVRLLNASFAEAQPLGSDPGVQPTRAVLARTEDFDPSNTASVIKQSTHVCSVYIYRIDFNKILRASWAAVSNHDGLVHLPLDLHFLLTAWSSDVESELKIMGRAMLALESLPSIAGPLFGTAAGLSPSESIQLVLEEIGTEAVMRMFDSLPVDYRLSVPYIARVVRIDGESASRSPSVLRALAGVEPATTPLTSSTA